MLLLLQLLVASSGCPVILLKRLVLVMVELVELLLYCIFLLLQLQLQQGSSPTSLCIGRDWFAAKLSLGVSMLCNKAEEFRSHSQCCGKCRRS